jgi:RND family efflux transporter MFP subunit
MQTKHIIASTLVLSLIALLSGCGEQVAPAPAQPQALPVSVATPIERTITEHAEFTGRLEAVEMVDVKPRVSGYIQSIHFEEGQRVKKGDLLFIIDQRPFQAQVNRLEAQVSQADAALALATANLKRSQKLITGQAISQEEADIRSSEALQAEADLAAANAELEAGALDLSFTKVIAPIDESRIATSSQKAIW